MATDTGGVTIHRGGATGSKAQGDCIGTDVTLAAPIADRARRGQILISEAVRTVVGSRRPGVEFGDAGPRQLKGRQRLYEVVWS